MIKNENRLDPAQQKLVETHLELVSKVITKYIIRSAPWTSRQVKMVPSRTSLQPK